MATKAAEDHKIITTTNFKLKLMVDRKRNKVLFAEAQKDFLDFLIYILSLPLSAVANYVAAPSTISKLYSSIALLEKRGHMKQTALHQRSCSSVLVPHLVTHVPILPRLTPLVPYAVQRTMYYCTSDTGVGNVKDWVYRAQCSCEGAISIKPYHMRSFVDQSAQTSEADYVKEMIAYMVTDELWVSPLNSASVFHAVTSCDPSYVEEKEVNFGSTEALMFLKATMNSDEPFTSVFLRPRERSNLSIMASRLEI